MGVDALGACVKYRHRHCPQRSLDLSGLDVVLISVLIRNISCGADVVDLGILVALT